MQNSTRIFHSNDPRHSAPYDLYATCVSGETAFLPVNAVREDATDYASFNANCVGCEKSEQMVPAEKAARICQCSCRLIYRWIEEGSLHYRELPDGTVLVCGVTLTAKLGQLEDATGHLAR